MKHFGIDVSNAYGASMPEIRNIAKLAGKNHELAVKLWHSKIHEARILATLVEEPELISRKQMQACANDFKSWDLCDQACMNLFRKTKYAFKIIDNWAKSEKEFVKRAAFTLIATLAVHAKEKTDKDFEKYFPLIIKHSTDERNGVKKAVNWALRQIGKRNAQLGLKAIMISAQLKQSKNKVARWIGADAYRELVKKYKN